MVKCLQKRWGTGDQIQNLLSRQSRLQLTLAYQLRQFVLLRLSLHQSSHEGQECSEVSFKLR